jgi:hypothetical protein
MEKPNSYKNLVFNAKRNLENSLGDEWQKYLSHLRKFFRNGNKIGKSFILFQTFFINFLYLLQSLIVK